MAIKRYMVCSINTEAHANVNAISCIRHLNNVIQTDSWSLVYLEAERRGKASITFGLIHEGGDPHVARHRHLAADNCRSIDVRQTKPAAPSSV